MVRSDSGHLVRGDRFTCTFGQTKAFGEIGSECCVSLLHSESAPRGTSLAISFFENASRNEFGPNQRWQMRAKQFSPRRLGRGTRARGPRDESCLLDTRWVLNQARCGVPQEFPFCWRLKRESRCCVRD